MDETSGRLEALERGWHRPRPRMAGVYVPCSPTTGVLYGVVRTHLADFLAAVAARTEGSGLPPFVVNEFRKFLCCGVLAHHG